MTSPLTPPLLWDIPRVGAPVAGADTVVVPVTTYPAEAGLTRLWRVPVDGGEPSPLTSRDASATRPAVSPDGSRLAFLRSVAGRAQVHVMPLAGGEPEAVTDLPLGALGARWFPDSRQLLVVGEVFVGAATIEGTARIREERAEREARVRTTEAAVFRYWDRWLTDGRVPHLFVVEPGSDPRDLTPTSTRWMRWDNTSDPLADLDISPDGSEVAACFDVSAPPHRDLRWSLFTLDAHTGGETELTPGATGHVSSPRYTADGSALVYGETLDPHFYADRVRLQHRHLATGNTRELSPGWDRSPSSWIVDGSGIVMVAEDEGSQPLWTLPLEGGVPAPIGPAGTLSGPLRLSDGRILAVHDSLSSPPEVVVIDGSRRSCLTGFTAPALAGCVLPEVEEFRFVGARGDEVQGWLVRPPSAPSPAPLVHLIHGGPHGSFGDAWHWRWNAAVFCGDSRVAALVNFHGSTGFGQEYAECIRGAWGDLPATDIERATEHLVTAGVADPARLAIAGGSYGGYLVAWLTSQTDRYRCAVAHAAVTDLPGMYASDVTAGRAHAYGAEVWEDLGAVNRWSPAAHAGGYSTPTLVIHGDRDYRVPVSQGLELYGLLQAKGVEARLVHYPQENHWILSKPNSLHWYDEVDRWLGRHLG